MDTERKREGMPERKEGENARKKEEREKKERKKREREREGKRERERERERESERESMRLADNGPQLGLEAHVEHPVRLVEHEVRDLKVRDLRDQKRYVTYVT